MPRRRGRPRGFGELNSSSQWVPVLAPTYSLPLLQWYGHPRVLGFPIRQTLVIWASPSHITLAIWVRVTGDTLITMVLGMGMPQMRGCPYHCDTATVVRTKVWYRTYMIRGEAFQRTKALWSDWSMVRTMQVISNLRRYDINCAQSLRLYKQAKRERRREGELRRDENGRESSSALGTTLRFHLLSSSPSVGPIFAHSFLTTILFSGTTGTLVWRTRTKRGLVWNVIKRLTPFLTSLDWVACKLTGKS